MLHIFIHKRSTETPWPHTIQYQCKCPQMWRTLQFVILCLRRTLQWKVKSTSQTSALQLVICCLCGFSDEGSIIALAVERVQIFRNSSFEREVERLSPFNCHKSVYMFCKTNWSSISQKMPSVFRDIVDHCSQTGNTFCHKPVSREKLLFSQMN